MELRNVIARFKENRAKRKEESASKSAKEKFVEQAKSLGKALAVFYVIQTFLVQAFTIPTSSMENTLMVGDFLFVNKFVYGAQTPENVPLTNIQLPRVRFPAFSDPEQGDVVVFRFPHPELYPDQYGLDYIKRCIAIGGQTIEVVNKELFVDGKKFTQFKDVPGLQIDRDNPSKGSVFPIQSGTPDNFGPFRVPAKDDVIQIDRSTAQLVKYLCAREQRSFEPRFDGYYIDGVKTQTYTVEQNYYFMMGDNRDDSLDSRFWGPVPRDLIIGEALFVYWSNARAAQQEFFLYKILTTLNLAEVQWSRIGTVVR